MCGEVKIHVCTISGHSGSGKSTIISKLNGRRIGSTLFVAASRATTRYMRDEDFERVLSPEDGRYIFMQERDFLSRVDQFFAKSELNGSYYGTFRKYLQLEFLRERFDLEGIENIVILVTTNLMGLSNIINDPDIKNHINIGLRCEECLEELKRDPDRKGRDFEKEMLVYKITDCVLDRKNLNNPDNSFEEAVIRTIHSYIGERIKWEDLMYLV